MLDSMHELGTASLDAHEVGMILVADQFCQSAEIFCQPRHWEVIRRKRVNSKDVFNVLHLAPPSFLAYKK